MGCDENDLILGCVSLLSLYIFLNKIISSVFKTVNRAMMMMENQVAICRKNQSSKYFH